MGETVAWCGVEFALIGIAISLGVQLESRLSLSRNRIVIWYGSTVLVGLLCARLYGAFLSANRKRARNWKHGVAAVIYAHAAASVGLLPLMLEFRWLVRNGVAIRSDLVDALIGSGVIGALIGLVSALIGWGVHGALSLLSVFAINVHIFASALVPFGAKALDRTNLAFAKAQEFMADVEGPAPSGGSNKGRIVSFLHRLFSADERREIVRAVEGDQLMRLQTDLHSAAAKSSDPALQEAGALYQRELGRPPDDSGEPLPGSKA